MEILRNFEKQVDEMPVEELEENKRVVETLVQHIVNIKRNGL